MLENSNDPTPFWPENLSESQLEHLEGEPQSLLTSSAMRSKKQDLSKYKSTRRILRILDLVSHQEGLTAKLLAEELEVSLATCYSLVKILTEEGYLEKIPKQRGYKLGPTISLLYKRASTIGIDSTVEPVIEELAERSERHAYFAVLEDSATEVTRVQIPPKSPPVGIARGFTGASHALALGKVLLASAGTEVVEDYIENHELVSFTPRTITYPRAFREHLDKVLTLGYATDLEEFAETLCCIAVPIKGTDDQIKGAVGVSTTAKHFRNDARQLLHLTQRAAKDASMLLQKDSKRLRQ